MKFATLFLRYYDRKIGSGEMSFSQIGISKDDFTRLCTDSDYVPNMETVLRVCENMKLSLEEREALIRSAGGEI